MFQNNQRALYEQIGGKEKSWQDPPNADGACEFWNNFSQLKIS